MEFVDGRETRRRDVNTTTTTVVRYYHHHRHLSHPQSLVITTMASMIRLSTTTVTLVSSLFLLERVNLLSFSPTFWWSQREQRCRWRYDGGVAVCGEQNMPIVLQKFKYKEVGVLGLPMKVSVEEGALVFGAGLFSLWSFVLGVLVLAWYREWWVQVCLVLCVLCWPPLRLLSLCLVGSWQECRQF
ncbi:hypothetical protein F2Q69_00042450 [Brassica cretica]|uniref:Transmembrane protein n=1 Tax=Brassica cretica TaxID=69181 RepID=A0A8S9NL72_BRACR|nr:hypothetical protein F2Q69_00042450 [Brassica cretica]